MAPVVGSVDGSQSVDSMKWGLVPEWSPEFTTKLSTINAKSGTMFETELYRKAILQRRCTVPMSGFIEWKKDGLTKRPFKIYQKVSPIMALAGIWTSWRAGSPEEGRSFSIMTTAANDLMSKIHDRMPVIPDAKDWDQWLDPEVHEPADIATRLKPCPTELLDCCEVSTLINSPKNNRAEVLEPLKVGLELKSP